MPCRKVYVNSNREKILPVVDGQIEGISLSVGIDAATGADYLEIHDWEYFHPSEDEPVKFYVPTTNVERELERLSSTAAASRPRAAKGPVRGEIDRFGDADRALFPEIERLMQSQHLTSTEAVQQIPEDKLAGRGTLDSRIRRVSDRFRREKL
jgi:hypothetical protein